GGAVGAVGRLEDGRGALPPGAGIQRVRAGELEQAELVARVGALAGGVRDENPATVVERLRALVDRIGALPFPVVRRCGEQGAVAGHRPGVGHRDDVDVLCWTIPGREHEVAIAPHLEQAAVDGPVVEEPAPVVVGPHGIGAFALQHVRALGAQIVAVAGRVVVIPAEPIRAVDQVERRRPHVAAAGAVAVLPDHGGCGVLQLLNGAAAFHGEGRAPGGGREVVVALVIDHPGIRAVRRVEGISKRRALAARTAGAPRATGAPRAAGATGCDPARAARCHAAGAARRTASGPEAAGAATGPAAGRHAAAAPGRAAPGSPSAPGVRAARGDRAGPAGARA